MNKASLFQVVIGGSQIQVAVAGDDEDAAAERARQVYAEECPDRAPTALLYSLKRMGDVWVDARVLR